MSTPLVIDLYCGLGGWTQGFLEEGYRAIGFDNERHDYGTGGYPGQLVLQDVLTLHGSQFRDATVIVASPPCQEFSYAAMPWKRAKAEVPKVLPDWWRKTEPNMTPAELAEWKLWKAQHPAKSPSTALFDACFRIQREAIAATGYSRTCPECDGEAMTRGCCRCERCDGKGYLRVGTHHIPLIVENVKGAQPWVGRAKWHYGSFYLWGDVPALMPSTLSIQKFNPDGTSHGQGSWFKVADSKNRGSGRKVTMNFHEFEKTGKPGRSFQSAAVDSFGWDKNTPLRNNSSHSAARKAASARIAMIPLPLSRWIAQCFKPAAE